MPRLPDVNDLGGARPVAQQQGVVRIDGQQIGQALESTGDRMSNLGLRIQEREDRMNYAKANAKFTQDMINLDSQFDQDQDYKTFGQRYQEGVKKIKSEASSMINNRSLRESFDLNADTEITRGFDRLAQKAWAKERDTGIASLNDVIAMNRENALRAGDDVTAMKSLTETRNAIQAAQENGYIDKVQAQKLHQVTAIDYATGKASMLAPEDRIKALQSNKLYEVIPIDKRKEMIEDAQHDIEVNLLKAERAKNLAYQDTMIRMADQIEQGGNPTKDPQWSSLTPAQRTTMLRYHKSVNGGTPVKTDFNRYTELYKMAGDPKRKNEFASMDLSAEPLGNAERKEMLKLQMKINNGEATEGDPAVVSTLSNLQAANESIDTILGGKSKSKYTDEDREIRSAFLRVYSRNMNTWLQENPGIKKVPETERARILDDLSSKMVFDEHWYGDEDGNPIAQLVREEGLTAQQVDKISADLVRNRIPPTSINIYQAYKAAQKAAR